MSGGVDSSVTATLLKEKGYDVIGITMQIWESSREWGGCCGIDSIEDAKKVARRLGIPHYVLNFRKIFKEKVIGNFCNEYKEGRTPNPCIRCNQYIKFDALLEKARQLSADYIATGHYARIEFDDKRKRYILRKGIDSKKDQSYVLYTMTQEQLKHTLMPLGNFTKKQVRQIAQDKDLPVKDKSESQEICFIPGGHYMRFIEKYIPEEIKPGPIVDKEGRVIGSHHGIAFYTIGQRKGIGIAGREPLYVLSINKEDNTIVVGKKGQVFSKELVADHVNFIYNGRPKMPIRAEAKIRYLHPVTQATIIALDSGRVKVKFDRPQWAVTPGQAVVFYNKDVVIGGGTIINKN